MKLGEAGINIGLKDIDLITGDIILLIKSYLDKEQISNIKDLEARNRRFK